MKVQDLLKKTLKTFLIGFIVIDLKTLVNILDWDLILLKILLNYIKVKL